MSGESSPHSKESYHNYGTSHPAPPPRALELVKEEVHRALQAFSTRPIKGEPQPPLPSDLLKPFDVSKDGKVTYPEFKAGLRGLGLGLTAGEAEELARDVDGEGTGLVDRQRFETVAIEDWGRKRRSPTVATAAQQWRGDNELSLDETTGESKYGGASRCVAQREQQRAGEVADGGGMLVTDHTAVRGGRNIVTSPRSMPVEETRHVTPRCNGDMYADHIPLETHDDTYELKEAPPPGESPLPHTSPLGTTSKLQGPSTKTNSSGQPRSGPTVSFDCWRRMADSREGIVDGAAASIGNIARGRGARVTTCSNTHERRANGRRYPHQKRQKHALATLRSLLERDGFDSGNHVNQTHHRSSTTIHSGRADTRCSGLDHVQDRGGKSHREAADSSGSGGIVAGEGRRRGMDRGRGLRRAEQRVARPYSAPAGSRRYGEGRREREDATARGRKSDDVLASQQDAESARRNAARAESILRLRSRGDLVGLRRSLSRADPSASGVVSRREMDRVILRRFGTGLGDDETKELAARYHKDFNGRAMVDYGRLVDTLEAMEAGIFGRAVRAVGDPSERCPRQAEHKRRQSGSSRAQAAPPGNIAPVRGRTNRQRYGKGYECADDGGGGGGDSAARVPAEEGQLMRRARSKTLALLDQHGTRRVDCIFELVDPGQCVSCATVYLLGLRVRLRYCSC